MLLAQILYNDMPVSVKVEIKILTISLHAKPITYKTISLNVPKV